MKTFALNENWDIGLDEFGNIAIKEGNERLAQDVASSVRVFKGEMPFDVDRGIAYNNPDELQETLNYDITEQAELVSGVANCVVEFNKMENRELDTTIYVTNEEGEIIEVNA